MNRYHEVQQLWLEHVGSRFPQGIGEREIGGVDLAEVDTFTAGCVESFLVDRELDVFKTSVLGICYHDLGIARSILEEDARVYFDRLHRLARLVLEAVQTGASAPDPV